MLYFIYILLAYEKYNTSSKRVVCSWKPEKIKNVELEPISIRRSLQIPTEKGYIDFQIISIRIRSS